MIKNIFFDLDHTLYDFERNSALTFNRILEEEQIPVELDAFLEIYVPINHAYWKRYRENRIDKSELRFGRLNDAFKGLDLEVDSVKINRLSERYIEVLPDFNHLFPHSHEILDYLTSKDYKLHLITNGFEEVQMRKCKSAKIDHYFDQFIYSESVGVKKPHPAIFEFALQSAGAEAQQSVMIGDNLEADIQGALKMDMDAIYCNFDQSPGNDLGVKEINGLIELKKLL